MWNNKFHLMWIKLEFGQNRISRLPVPVPLYIMEEIFDCIQDILTVACLLAPDGKIKNTPYSVHNLKDMVQMAIRLSVSLTGEEPYELVDITAQHVRVSIQIR
jgi:hypothetical protein